MSDLQALATGYRLAQIMGGLGDWPQGTFSPLGRGQADDVTRSYSNYQSFVRAFFESTRTSPPTSDGGRALWGCFDLPKADSLPAASAGAVQGPTFDELVSERQAQVASGVLNLGTFNNERTSLRKFAKFMDAALESSAAQCFGERFEPELERFLRTVQTHSRAAYRTRLETWHRLYQGKLAALDCDRPIAEVLRDHLGEPGTESYGKRLSEVATAAVISTAQLRGWASGQKLPANRISTHRKLAGLERVLKLEGGTLTRKSGSYPGQRPRSGLRVRDYAQEDYHRVISKLRIRPLQWPPEIEVFVERLTTFKVGSGLVLDAAGDPIIDGSGRRHGWRAPTAEINVARIWEMVSWLCLPQDRTGAEQRIRTSALKIQISAELKEKLVPMFQGKGLQPHEVKVAHLLDPVLVDGLLRWRRLRALGRANQGPLKYLSLLKSMLAPQHGFVTQQPELAWSQPDLRVPKLDVMDPRFLEMYAQQKKIWAEVCAKRHLSFSTMAARLEKEIGDGGDSGPRAGAVSPTLYYKFCNTLFWLKNTKKLLGHL